MATSGEQWRRDAVILLASFRQSQRDLEFLYYADILKMRS